MKITVNSKIIVIDPTPAVQKWCRENLVIDNPEYYKKERMGKWTGNTPRDIWLYERMGDELWIPFGCLQSIWRLCVRGVQWNVQIADIRSVLYQSGIDLYPSRSEVQPVGAGVPGNTAESREEGQDTAADVGSSVEEAGGGINTRRE